jgi:predicted RNA-binding Zn ribbon-like protein
VKQAAPGQLELVRGFVNTLELETCEDVVGDSGGLKTWLAEHRLLEPGAPVSPMAVQRAAAVREALRWLLRSNAGEPVDPDAVATLEAAVHWSRLTVVFDDRGRIRVEPGRPGVAGAVGRLLAIVADAMADGTWSRLKACGASDCRWAFYDHTRNRSGRWCSMAVCGNRAKVRAYRTRQEGTRQEARTA